MLSPIAQSVCSVLVRASNPVSRASCPRFEGETPSTQTPYGVTTNKADSRWWDLNPQPRLYESRALPLSYIGEPLARMILAGRVFVKTNLAACGFSDRKAASRRPTATPAWNPWRLPSQIRMREPAFSLANRRSTRMMIVALSGGPPMWQKQDTEPPPKVYRQCAGNGKRRRGCNEASVQ